MAISTVLFHACLLTGCAAVLVVAALLFQHADQLPTPREAGIARLVALLMIGLVVLVLWAVRS